MFSGSVSAVLFALCLTFPTSATGSLPCNSSHCLYTESCVNLGQTYFCKPTFTSPIISQLSNKTTLASTLGEHVNFTINYGSNFALSLNEMQNFFVQFKPDQAPTYMTEVNMVNLGGNQYFVTCKLPPGLGKALVLNITYNVSGEIYWSASEPWSYPPPVIFSATLHINQNSPSSFVNAIDRVNGDMISFSGQNFYPDSSLLQVTYGPPNVASLQTKCTLSVQGSSTTLVTCLIAPQSSGMNMVFTVYANGYTATGTDTYSVPNVPDVQAIIGCSGYDGHAVSACPTAGGVVLTLTGINFNLGTTAVTINNKSCNVLSNSCPSTCTLTCVLPAGTGFNRGVVVTSNSIASQSRPLVSYAAPSITSLTGCTAGASLSIYNCPRAGGILITILGVNFGASGVVVWVGNSLMTVISQSNSQIVAALPTGESSSASMLVQQGAGGPASDGQATIGYLQCLPGYYDIGVPTCSTCTAGKYSNQAGASVCLACDTGTYSGTLAQTVCTHCMAGSYGDVQGRTACLVCDAGYYSAADGASMCRQCDGNTYQPKANSTTCLDCSSNTTASTAHASCNTLSPTTMSPVIASPSTAPTNAPTLAPSVHTDANAPTSTTLAPSVHTNAPTSTALQTNTPTSTSSQTSVPTSTSSPQTSAPTSSVIVTDVPTHAPTLSVVTTNAPTGFTHAPTPTVYNIPGLDEKACPFDKRSTSPCNATACNPRGTLACYQYVTTYCCGNTTIAMCGTDKGCSNGEVAQRLQCKCGKSSNSASAQIFPTSAFALFFALLSLVMY